MGVLGIVTCEILELEFAYLLGTDPEVNRITVLKDTRSSRLINALEAPGIGNLSLIPQINAFHPDPSLQFEVLIEVLELALHNRKKTLQQGLAQAVREMNPHVDGFLLGYGLCGNALENPEELLSDTDVPIFIPMDEDHPVDDCVGLLMGGRKRYYDELCKIAGTFFMIPGWTYHWRRIFHPEFGNLSMDIAKRLFAHYERSLLVQTPLMALDEMKKNVEEFNTLFGFRNDIRQGTLRILQQTWHAAKEAIMK